jgi:electron transfer flavoprotein beta subunit
MERHIIVCIKAVMLEAPKGRAIRTSETCDLNPFDRYAIETALQLREKLDATVTALSMGPDTCSFALCDALAMGVDRAILLSDAAFAGSDTLATSTVLSAAIGKLESVDLILFGTRTSDSDTGQVGPQTAAILNLPFVTGAIAMEKTDDGLKVERRADGFIELFELTFPAAITIHPAAGPPRDAQLGSIASAYDTRAVERWTLKDLDLSERRVGEGGSPTRVVSLNRVKKERKCEVLSGEPEEQAETLIRKLLESGLIG